MGDLPPDPHSSSMTRDCARSLFR